MRIMKRLIAFLMVLLMVVCLFASCNKKPAETEDTGVPTPNETPTGEIETEEDVVLDLPDDLDYGGDEIKILVRSSSLAYHEFNGSENPTVVDSAVFDRNAWVEEMLHVTFTFNHMNGFAGGANAFMTEIRNSIAGGDSTTYDILAPTHYFGNQLILEGLYQNLADMEYIDLDQTYWWDGYTDHVSINNKVYTVTGDYSVDSLACLQAVFFNKELAEAHQLGDPYEMVENETWTLGNLLTMAQKASIDLNEDGNYDTKDQIGWILGTQAVTAVPVACDSFYITKRGETEFDITFMSERAENILSTLQEAMGGNGMYYFPQTSQIVEMVDMFAQGKAVFLMHSFESMTAIRGSDVDYGILVYPKYDEEQKNYITPSTGGTVFAIPVCLNEEDTERSAAVLQALGYASYVELTPAYFETTLKAHGTRDEESYEMLDLIRETAVFDVGQVFMRCISRANSAFNDCVLSNEALSTWYATYGGTMETELTELINNKYFK